MGSPDPVHVRQLNGMGGGISSLSKICVVGPPSQELRSQFTGLDVNYTFAQVGIRDSVIDYSGNCGNLSTMIGVFALDDKICKPKDSSLHEDPRTGVMTATIRSLNENTSKLVDTTFPVQWNDQTKSWSPVLDLDQTSLAGVPGRASKIVLDFVSPGGAGTGKLLPTGNPVDTLQIETPSKAGLSIRASLVDATNPTVFITSQDLREVLGSPSDTPIDYADPGVVATVEAVRKAGAVKMGLDSSLQAQPKIAILSLPPPNTDVDIEAHAFSMGVLHKACPATLALCLGVASKIKDSLAWDLVHPSRTRDPDSLVNLRHPSGVLTVGASIDANGEVLSAKVVGTGRRLMTGFVWW
jgi:2-methylaconitate cis-trans-isomerase PrpF